jgi:hypothetical protein
MSGTSGIVTFDYPAWSELYPEFAATVNQPQAQQFFDLATLYVDNTPCSLVPFSTNPVFNLGVQIVPGNPIRAPILNLVTAHIAQLMNGSSNQPAGPLVGRISDVSEGSVSISTDVTGLPGSAVWFAQTKYGLAAWQAMAPFRAGMFIPPPQIPLAAQSWPGGAFGFGFVLPPR